MLDDTIAAISTPLGSAGIGIVKVSGKNAIPIVDKIFCANRQKKIAEVRSHSLIYGHIIKPNGTVIDEVLVSVMREPHSFTAENVVEINCHGGILAVQEVLSATLKAGARLAEPGEFSKRAFLNGRVDLAQAESIIDLINAKTQVGLNVAVKQLKGALSSEVMKIRFDLLEALAHIEAGIDFPEHDIEELSRAQITDKAEGILASLRKLINSAHTGKIFREGLRTVIVGKPNVGKSSLLNAMVRENRAIVTEIPGTTRDIIEEVVNIRGIPLVLIDTAGIRETEDIVEKMGVEKAKERFKEADLILLMVDASTGLTVEDREILPLVKEKNCLVVVNKTDIIDEIDVSELEKQTGIKDTILMSILTGQGLDKLEEKIEELVYGGLNSGTEELLVTNVRHKHALERAASSIEELLTAVEFGMPTDCMAIDIKDAMESLGEITGETVNEDLVDQIFSRFCIGK